MSLSVLSSIAPTLFGPQALFFLSGAVVFAAVSCIPFSLWKKIHFFLFGSVVFLLCLTLVLGVVRKGATRWISLGPINIQASQIAQPLCIISFAFFLQRYSLRSPKYLLWYIGLVFFPFALIIIEPNLSTSLIFLFTAGFMALDTDLPWSWIAFASVGLVMVAIIGWLFIVQPYQKQRIFTFLSPQNNREEGYNAYQSIVAVGSGQLFGRGLGHGIQSQLRFLPERQTDFIFASLAEELGLVGSFSVLTLYAILLGFLSYKLLETKNFFIRSVLTGFLSFFSIQVGINIGMNMGILPITGITLPLLSYGGSSILSFSVCLGILERVVIETKELHVFSIK